MNQQTLRDLFASRSGGPGPWRGTGTSIACRDLMEQTGASFPEAHLQPEAMARLAATGHTVLGFDIVMPLYSVCHEVAALGMDVSWGNPNAMPESGPPIFRTAAEIRIPPDFLTRSACVVPRQAIALLRQRLGDDCVVCGKVFGPWTLAYHLFGIENFLMLTIDDPDEVRRILERLVEVTRQFARVQIEAGADCLLLGDHATRDLCSPATYEQFVLPVHTQLAQQIAAPLILHICGNTLDRIPMIARTGVAAFHWDTKSGDPATVRRLAGENLVLMGGVGNLMLLQGQPAEVAAQARQAANDGIDIIGPECAIPLGTPLVNLQAIAPAVNNR